MVDPIELLRQRLEGHSQREIARAAGVSDSHLSDILSLRRSPKGVLKFLGLEKRVTYHYANGSVSQRRIDRARVSRGDRRGA